MVMRHFVWCRSAFNRDFSNDYIVVYFNGMSPMHITSLAL